MAGNMLRKGMSKWRSLYARVSSCPGKEHEQAIVRIVSAGIATLYFISWESLTSEQYLPDAVVPGSIAFLTVALLLLAWVAAYPTASMTRRVVAT